MPPSREGVSLRLFHSPAESLQTFADTQSTIVLVETREEMKMKMEMERQEDDAAAADEEEHQLGEEG